MSGPTFLRHLNEKRVLRQLKEHGTLSRAELARHLNLTRSTVTAVADELIEKGLVRGTGRSYVTQLTGRPGEGLELNPDGAYFVGVEIGADKIHGLLINLAGAIIKRETISLRSKRPDWVFPKSIDLVDSVTRSVSKISKRLRGVGFAVSAMLDREGMVRLAPTLGWHQVNIRKDLLAQLAVPAFIENDANASALAELSFGHRPGSGDLCLLRLDIGVGAGIISDRQLFRGNAGLAGEIGHLCLDPSKYRSREEIGFLESRLGRDGLLAEFRRAGGSAKNFEEFLPQLQKTSAQEALKNWAEWLMLTLCNLGDLFNPRLVILAGPLAQLYPLVEDLVRHRLKEREFPTGEGMEIAVSTFGRDSAALGGAALAYDQLLSVPDAMFLRDFSRAPLP